MTYKLKYINTIPPALVDIRNLKTSLRLKDSYVLETPKYTYLLHLLRMPSFQIKLFNVFLLVKEETE